MSKIFSLDQAPEQQPLVVISVDCEQAMQSRLGDLGLTAGSSITCLYPSAFGDPRAYLVRGAVLGIRNSDAGNILCRRENENEQHSGLVRKSQRGQEHRL